MSYIVGEIPYLRGFVRREYTKDRKSGHGEFLPCIIYGVRCIRGKSLELQCMLTERFGGAAWLLPIEAFCWRPCDMPEGMEYVQPWDVFSECFGVHTFSFTNAMKVDVLPGRLAGRYHTTLDFAGNDLSEDAEQHKHLHIVRLDSGWIGAFPNNRLLYRDPAFWDTMAEKPDFAALSGEFRAE